MKKVYLFVAGLLLLLGNVSAQREIAMPPIPAIRQLHHESIVNSLNTISKFPVTRSDTLNRSIFRSVRVMVNNMRASVEINNALDNNAKFRWLRGINDMLTSYISGYRARVISGSLLSNLVKSYDDAMRLEINGRSILGVVRDSPLEVGQILVDNYALQDNPGVPKAKDMLVLKACQRDPDNILKILKKYPNNTYADSLIIQAALRDQEDLYNYASDVNSALGKRIQSINHPLVKTIAKMATMRTGRMYFPFLDDIYHGKVSMDSIAPFLQKDSTGDYYSLLVKTRIGYADRMSRGDTPMAAQALTNKLRSKAVELYINEINALHDLTNLNVRFKKLEGLTAQELYYIAVLGEEEIYTSSFVSGVYPRLMARLGKAKSDTLLAMVHNDFYKKFIKMCAAYNTLDKFFDRMDKGTSETYMKNFVAGLENTRTLEDAVDVADSYGSIYDKGLRKLILDQVQLKLAENERKRNTRGRHIYDILNTIFLSMDSSNHIDVSAKLGINPVYIMPNQLLRDTSKRVIIQQFFYGDKDGRTYYNAFLSQFRNANWRITQKPQWVEVQSVKGAPVTIYSNLPLDEKQDLDAESQDKLIEYLADKELEPTVVIHRGHSYYLNSTISKLPSSGKVILVGSCGGYQMLNKVLEICPGAHIISSKQVGAGIINQGMINLITEQLRQGKDLNWPTIWRTLSGKFTGNVEEKFDDYVPPYKNLGAIFITAYNNNNR